MDKLEGINPGDRVRVTFEGVVHALTAEWLSIPVDGGGAVSNIFSRDDINSPHFHIERIEKPLAVGDRVNYHVYGAGVVLALRGCIAFVEWVEGAPSAVHISNLERLS